MEWWCWKQTVMSLGLARSSTLCSCSIRRLPYSGYLNSMWWVMAQSWLTRWVLGRQSVRSHSSSPSSRHIKWSSHSHELAMRTLKKVRMNLHGLFDQSWSFAQLLWYSNGKMKSLSGRKAVRVIESASRPTLFTRRSHSRSQIRTMTMVSQL